MKGNFKRYVNQITQNVIALPRPRLHGTGRIWNRSEIRPFRPCKRGLNIWKT